ncbi:hypothetical protein AGMMS4957_12820 [Bacteroidia bacterium]|nr:hypothetical protein AGMMS4957_12820 [Bacteroidia bacterium]
MENNQKNIKLYFIKDIVWVLHEIMKPLRGFGWMKGHLFSIDMKPLRGFGWMKGYLFSIDMKPLRGFGWMRGHLFSIDMIPRWGNRRENLPVRAFISIERTNNIKTNPRRGFTK